MNFPFFKKVRQSKVPCGETGKTEGNKLDMEARRRSVANVLVNNTEFFVGQLTNDKEYLDWLSKNHKIFCFVVEVRASLYPTFERVFAGDKNKFRDDLMGEFIGRFYENQFAKCGNELTGAVEQGIQFLTQYDDIVIGLDRIFGLSEWQYLLSQWAKRELSKAVTPMPVN